MDIDSLPTDISAYRSSIDGGSIRLLHIVRDPEGTFSGTLKTFPLSDAPPFYTASYVWGTKSFSNTVIKLNAGNLPVLESLVPFLKLITECDDFSDRDWWWVDSLCINLQDGEEREQQVRVMGDIYKRARRAIVWLGREREENSDCLGAMGFLHQLNDLRSTFKDMAPFRVQLRQEKFAQQWAAVSRLLSRSWWSRVWTLQEFILPKEAKLYCGESSISRGKFKTAMYCIFLCSTSIPENEPPLIPRLAFDSAFNRRRIHQWFVHPQSRGMSLVAMLAYMGNQSATDCRDRVYSVLGLITAQDRRVAGVPEYKSSVQQLYASLVRSFWEEYQSLDIICFSHMFSRYTGPSDLGSESAVPSWVPDWRAQSEFASPVPLMASACKHVGNFRPLHSRTYKAVYEASGKWLKRHANVKFLPGLREMKCDGAILDKVDGLGSLEGCIPRCRSFVCEDSGHQVVQRKYKTGTSSSPLDILEEISRSLVLDRQDKYLRFTAPPHYQSNFLSLCHKHQEGQNVNPLFSAWFQHNKGLRIHGLTLEELLHEISSSDPSLLLSLPSPIINSLSDYPQVKQDEESDGLDNFLSRFQDTVRKKSRRLLITCQGHIGMAPCRTRQGDVIAILFGCNIPLVLRPVDSREAYQVIGECYVHGFMNREIENGMESGDVKVRRFRLV